MTLEQWEAVTKELQAGNWVGPKTLKAYADFSAELSAYWLAYCKDVYKRDKDMYYND